MWWTGLRGWKQMHKASFLFSDVSLCLAPRKLGKDFRPRKDTPSTPLGVWTERISLGKQECAFIEPRSFFISQSGFQPRRGSAGRYLFTSAPACLISCFHRSLHTSVFVLLALFIFPPTSSQTSFILPLIDPSRSIQPSAPLSLHQSSCPSLFFSFSLLRTNTPQVGLSPSSISLPALPADSVFAHGLGRALCHWGRKELIRLLFVVAFCVLWREADPPEADAHVHGCTHGEQSENRESDKERSTHTCVHTHTHTPARRNPTPRQTRAWVCVRSSTALLLAVCVRTRVFPHRPAAAFVPRAGLFSDWLANVWDTDLCYSSSAAALIWQILFSLLSSGARGHGGDVRQLRRRAARIAPPVWPCVRLPSSHGASCKVCLHTISYCSTHLQPLYQQVGWLASTHARPLHISWIYQMGLALVKFSPALRFR